MDDGQILAEATAGGIFVGGFWIALQRMRQWFGAKRADDKMGAHIERVVEAYLKKNTDTLDALVTASGNLASMAGALAKTTSELARLITDSMTEDARRYSDLLSGLSRIEGTIAKYGAEHADWRRELRSMIVDKTAHYNGNGER